MTGTDATQTIDGHGSLAHRRRKALAIGAVSSGTVLAMLDGSIVTVALPTIARDLRVDSSAAVMVVTVYQLVLVMALLPFSALGDKLGLKRLYQGGQAVFTVATALCFFAHSLPLLLVVRALQALGAAGTQSVTSAVVRSIYSRETLGRGLALNTLCAAVSAAAAPAVGGMILAVASWPWLFAASVPFAIVSLVVGRQGLPDIPPRAIAYDRRGAFYSALTFGLVVSGLEAWVHGAPRLVACGAVAAGLLVAVAFVRHELAQAHPIMPVDLLRRPVLGWAALGALFAYLSTAVIILSTPFRLQHGYGFTPRETGTVMMAWPLVTMVTAPTAGALSDRIPAGILGAIASACSMLAMILLIALPTHPSPFDLTWRLAFCGVGTGMYNTPNARLIIGSAPAHRTASAGGLASTLRLLAQTLGATIVAALLALGAGEGWMPPAISCGFACLAGLCCLARLNPELRRTNAAEEAEAAAL